jgi:predicted nucleotidyltransferase
MSKVAKVFFAQPTGKHYLREISEKSALAHTSVRNYLLVLKKEYVIRESIEKKGGRDYPFYTADTGSESYRKQKVVSNLSDLLESGLIEYIRDATMPNAIVLFGSYARGEDTEESDIDLFVQAKEKALDVSKFEKKLGRKVQLHFRADVKTLPARLKNSIVSGFTIFGSLEVFS